MRNTGLRSCLLAAGLVFSGAAFVVGPGSTNAGDSCPPDQFLLEEGTCEVCLLPATLQATGVLADPLDQPCYACESGSPSDFVTCDAYWVDALTSTEFDYRIRKLRYRVLSRRWSRLLAQGRTGAFLGRRLLRRLYADSLNDHFATQTDALDLLADLTHFANQFQVPGAWPPLRTEVSFSQLTWLESPGVPSIPHSHVGWAGVTPGVLDSQMLDEHGGAWVNILVRLPGFPGAPGPFPLDESDWRIRNMPMTFGTAAELAQVELVVTFGFDLPDGVPIPEVESALIVNEEPSTFFELTVTPEELEFLFGSVEPQDYLVGGIDEGDGDGGGSAFVVPDDIDLWDACPEVETDPVVCVPVEPPARMGPVSIPVESIPIVNEFGSHCVPGSIARALKILYGDDLPPAQAIMEEVRIDLGTNGASEGGAEDGTFTDDILPGKAAYGSRHNLVGLTTSRVDLEDYSFADAVDMAIATLLAGGVVEVRVGFGDGGGHMAIVSEIWKAPSGKVYITYVDDPVQGDNTAANKANLVACRPDGSFWYQEGEVRGFILETK